MAENEYFLQEDETMSKIITLDQLKQLATKVKS